MKFFALILMLPFAVFSAEQDNSQHQATPAPANAGTIASVAAHDHAAMPTSSAPLPAGAMQSLLHEHGGMLNHFVMAERVEQQQRNGEDLTLWDAQGWLGGDYHKLWLKTEGEWSSAQSAVEHSELQFLYSRAVAPFWDLQAGVRHDEGSAASRSYAVFGLQGLAPYWFEVDAAAFVGEKGVQLRVETEYDLRLTQKLLLQPRVQITRAFYDDAAAGITEGSFASSISLRLRYEIVREVAPYVGIEKAIGGQRQPDETRVVAGLRLWW